MTTARPDPAQDLIGYLRWLGDCVEILERQHDEDRLCAKDAALAMGMKPHHFYSKPWRVPTFGLEYDGQYPLSTWRAWLERPEAERRAEWDALPLRERSAARGLVQVEAKASRRSA